MAAYNYGLIPNEDAITFLKEKPERMEIVLTGRNPDERLIELADYVSEIKKESIRLTEESMQGKGLNTEKAL